VLLGLWLLVHQTGYQVILLLQSSFKCQLLLKQLIFPCLSLLLLFQNRLLKLLEQPSFPGEVFRCWKEGSVGYEQRILVFNKMHQSGIMNNSNFVDFVALLTKEADKFRNSCLQRVPLFLIGHV